MKKNVIVSLADANYFPLLDELINSIKKFKESEDVAICVLDAGLTQDQKDLLSKKVDEIKKADWDIEVPEFKVKGKEWLKSQVSRAFLPKYFPNSQLTFDIILYPGPSVCVIPNLPLLQALKYNSTHSQLFTQASQSIHKYLS